MHYRPLPTVLTSTLWYWAKTSPRSNTAHILAVLRVLSTWMAEPLALTIEDAFTKLYVPGAEVTMTFQLHRVLSPKPIIAVIVTSA